MGPRFLASAVYPMLIQCYIEKKKTSEKYFDMCTSSYLPLGVDDPKNKNAVGDTAVSLFNGAMEATVSHGARVPKSMAVISANFTIEKKKKGIYHN